MFPLNDYVPILKGKDGEYGALGSLSPEEKERITPLIEIPPIPWDHTEGVARKNNRPAFIESGSQVRQIMGCPAAFLH